MLISSLFYGTNTSSTVNQFPADDDNYRNVSASAKHFFDSETSEMSLDDWLCKIMFLSGNY